MAASDERPRHQDTGDNEANAVEQVEIGRSGVEKDRLATRVKASKHKNGHSGYEKLDTPTHGPD